MRYLLIYDIVHDGTRAKVADVCLDYGLARIQFSAFSGELSKVHLQELWVKIQRRVGRHTAKVYLYPLDEKSWQGRRLLERQGEE